MRPRPSEVIEAIRRILRDDVLPELTSPAARARVAEIRGVLAAVDWDDIALTHLRETRQLGRAVEGLLHWLEEDSDRAANFAPHLSARPTLQGGDSFDELEADRRALDNWFLAILEPLDAWLSHHPSVEGRHLRQAIADIYLE